MANTGGSFSGNVLKGIRYRVNKLASAEDKKAGLNWYKKWKLKHLPYNSPHTFDLNGKKVYFNNGQELLHSLKEIFVEEIYKIPFTNPSPYIIDCGANIGLAILYLKSKHPGAKITAFEPDKTNYSFLQKNINSAGLTDVELRNEAVWKEDAILKFSNEGTLSSKITEGGNAQNTVEVKATRLKNLLSRPVDFLKIDIEGAEYEVLKDCAESLKNVQFLFIEFHGHFEKMFELTDILQLVQDNGFAYYIREASMAYANPFYRGKKPIYDLQLNIFCFRMGISTDFK
ncbi:MAG TPA: FkbM family methyltransferase [Chitinophagaceae bacterium]